MDSNTSLDSVGPVFYIGHHETTRPLPVTEEHLRQAQAYNYDMLTSPITTPHFHSRVLTLLSSHLSQIGTYGTTSTISSSADPQPPLISPLMPVDTPLTPADNVSQLIAFASPWIDLCSPDPLIANISRQVLNLEIAYAAFCGISNIVITGPSARAATESPDGTVRFARAVQEALNTSGFLQIQILLPMVYKIDPAGGTRMGDLAPFAREEFMDGPLDEGGEIQRPELFSAWETWNVIRTVCKYNSRLSVALSLPRHLPSVSLQYRWHSEPLRVLSLHRDVFVNNSKGYPVLPKPIQALITLYMRLRIPPWLLLVDVGPLPEQEDVMSTTVFPDSIMSPSATQDAFLASGALSPSPIPEEPTPAEASVQAKHDAAKRKKKNDPTPHLKYIRHLQNNQPPRSIIETFGAGYQDYLQAPLQPLTDNLESITYEVFEKDPIKYEWYERAITAALVDWASAGKIGSAHDGRVVVAVVGAGRGPLVTRALRASAASGVAIEMWAVEKNPNAYVLLQRHNEDQWAGQVNIIKSDMRAWKGPVLGGLPSLLSPAIESSRPLTHGKVDILISELLGSFADNELSPECLDGVQHVLNPLDGISIPAAYTAHLTPIAAPKLHADISIRTPSDPNAPETPYVVMLHAVDFLSTTSLPAAHAPLSASANKRDSINPSSTSSTANNNVSLPPFPIPNVATAWEFTHPLSPSTLALSNLRRGGALAGGVTGGTDGSNEHNARYSRASFACRDRGVCHGLAGYFEAVLYGDVELSTNPATMEAKSRDMISWFPIFFPLKTPLSFPDRAQLDVHVWRQTDDRKVWYEWMVEAYLVLSPPPSSSSSSSHHRSSTGSGGAGGAGTRVRVGASELHSSRKTGCTM